jgi:hypothetical protein
MNSWATKKARLTDPGFVWALYKKALNYGFGADRYETSAKARFPKEIVDDPIFEAIHYCRAWFCREQFAEEYVKRLPARER